MVIIKVSSRSEKAMLNTVRVLRRLLRKAFLVTNRVNVMNVLREEPATGGGRWMRASANRIVELPSQRQLARRPRNRDCGRMENSTTAAHRDHIASAARNLCRDSLEPAFIGGRSIQCGNRRFVEPKIHRELSAVMGQMTEDRFRNHHVAGILADRLSANNELPRAQQVLLVSALQGGAGFGDRLIQRGQEFLARVPFDRLESAG